MSTQYQEKSAELPQENQPAIIRPRSVGGAIAMSAFVPGLGSLYGGEVAEGIVLQIAWLASLLLTFAVIGFLTAPVVWGVAVWRAYVAVTAWNSAHGIVSLQRSMEMSLDHLTEDQMELALDQAIAVRSARATLKGRLKRAEISGYAVLQSLQKNPGDAVIPGMRVREFLTALPGIGQAGADTLMERMGIHPNRRLRGLGENQYAALLIELGPENDSA